MSAKTKETSRFLTDSLKKKKTIFFKHEIYATKRDTPGYLLSSISDMPYAHSV